MVVVVVVGSIIVMNATKNKMTIVRNLVDNGGSIEDSFAIIVILALFLALVTFAAILSLLFCLLMLPVDIFCFVLCTSTQKNTACIEGMRGLPAPAVSYKLSLD